MNGSHCYEKRDKCYAAGNVCGQPHPVEDTALERLPKEVKNCTLNAVLQEETIKGGFQKPLDLSEPQLITCIKPLERTPIYKSHGQDKDRSHDGQANQRVLIMSVKGQPRVAQDRFIEVREPEGRKIVEESA